MRLNDMLGIQFPIIQGGMANIATGQSAPADATEIKID